MNSACFFLLYFKIKTYITGSILSLFLKKIVQAALKKSVESEAECPRRLSAACTWYVRKAAGVENEAIGDLLKQPYG